ncbi:hypothetical protein ACWJKU_18320 [Methylocaldum sp. MU1018]
MKMPALSRSILIVLGVLLFSSRGFSATSEFVTETTQHIVSGGEDVSDLIASERFGARIAGTYRVIRQPVDGPTRILNLFADGNLTGMQSVQFGGGVPREGFSNQHGTWTRVGEREIEASVLDLEYNPSTGEFLGTTIAHYDLRFDSAFRTITGRAEGKIFSPGVDPLNPGEAKPFFEFSDDFQAQRVTVGNAAIEPEAPGHH